MNFLNWFGALSLLTVTVGAIGTAATLSHFLGEEILQWDSLLTAEFIGTVAETQSTYGRFSRRTGVAELLGGVATPEELGVSGPGAKAAVSEMFDHLRALPGAVSIKVYAHDRNLVWSHTKATPVAFTEDEAADRQNVESAFAMTYAGSYAAIGHWEADEAKGADGRSLFFVENFVPLYDASHRVVAVVEIDKDPTRLKEAIRRGQAIVWLCLLAAEALIFLTLYWLARRATVVMRDQQRRLVDSEKLTVIGEMSLALAHGIRNPLAAIRSSAEIAIDDVPESARKPLRDIITQADRLGAWLRDLLQYSRPEPGRPQPVCIQDLVRECVDGYEARFAQAGITVKVVRSEGGIPLVATDRPLILQAFNSIISNAMEAMQGGGMLTITCGLDADERAVVVSFSDTGPGMTPERLAQAFQPFRTSKPRGLGIGLSLVKSTLERYGGHVHIDSRPGEGTRVELSIPLRGSPR